ncbi:MAG: sulfatase-like hydrolase/transferase [Planctomycetota bacterium]
MSTESMSCLIAACSGRLGVLLFALALLTQAAAAKQPNFILILADDLGHDDLGRSNPNAISPVLDGLAEESARLTDFHVHLKCAPSRASLLTGRYFQRTGVWGVHGGRDHMATDEVTLADAFREAGYTTAMMGKWHSGVGDRYYPWQRGFDLAHMANIYRYTPEENAAESVNGHSRALGDWAEIHFTDKAIDFVKQPHDKPFFLYLPYMSPHSPWRSPQSYQQPFLDRGDSENLAAFWGMVHFLDAQIGRVLDAVDEAGLAEDTVVVFISDNGPVPSGAHRPPGVPGKPYTTKGPEWNARNPHGLRGGKGVIYQNGVRSVMFARWPEQIEPGDVDGTVTSEDLFPTLLDLAGASVPTGTKPLDGVSVAALLRGDSAARRELQNQLADRAVFLPEAEPKDSFDPWRLGQQQRYEVITKTANPERFAFERMNLAVRRGDYKWVQNGGKVEVFDLKRDPRERKPVADAGPIADELAAAGRAWWESVLEDAAAFERPVQYIDAEDEDLPAIVQLRSAVEVHGVSLSAHGAFGWDRVGDSLVIDAYVGRPGTFRVYLLGHSKNATGAVFTVEFGGQTSASGRVDRALDLIYEKPVFGWDREQAIDLGTVTLGQPGPMRLTVRLDIKEGAKQALRRLDHLVFERVD